MKSYIRVDLYTTYFVVFWLFVLFCTFSYWFCSVASVQLQDSQLWDH